jgi:hypothetical protein
LGIYQYCSLHCQSYIISILSFVISAAYLIYVLERYIGNVWIGFYHEPYSVFHFVDYRSAAHTYWGSGQPSRQLSQRSCTQANITGSNFGVWDDVDCGTTNRFVCEIYKGNSDIFFCLFPALNLDRMYSEAGMKLFQYLLCWCKVHFIYFYGKIQTSQSYRDG